MRVLYDISTLGLGQLYVQSRGGSHRADQHVVAGLAADQGCDLLVCANHSSVAYQGAAAYVAEHRELMDVPIVGPARSGTTAAMAAAIRAAHRLTRAIVGSHVMPRVVRRGGVLVDRRVHPPVTDASPPADVFHSPGLPLPTRHAPGRGPERFLTLYDLAYLRYPEIYGAAYQRAASAIMSSFDERDWLIVASGAMRDELCDRNIAPPDRIFIVPLAADAGIFHPVDDPDRLAAVRTRYGIPDGPYALSVNSPDPRKNVPRAIHAFGRLVEQERIADLTLVLAGNHGPGNEQIVRALARWPALRDRVVLAGFVADEDLAALYSGAMAFVYPSIYEGFGLPPVEAMQCGTPVVAANVSAIPEVVGDAGLLIDPADDEALAGALLRLYRDNRLRQSVARRGRVRASAFTWERTIRLTLSAYATALGAARGIPEPAGV